MGNRGSSVLNGLMLLFTFIRSVKLGKTGMHRMFSVSMNLNKDLLEREPIPYKYAVAHVDRKGKIAEEMIPLYQLQLTWFDACRYLDIKKYTANDRGKLVLDFV